MNTNDSTVDASQDATVDQSKDTATDSDVRDVLGDADTGLGIDELILKRDQSNLLFMYRFDENDGSRASDSVDSGVRPCEADNLPQWDNGVILNGNRMSCTGFDDHAQVIAMDNIFSIEVWVGHRSGNASYVSWGEMRLNRNGNLRTYAEFSNGRQLLVNNFQRRQLHHLVLSCSGATCQLYEDGILMDSMIQPPISWQNADNLQVGGSGDVRIALLAGYNRPLTHLDAIRNYRIGPQFGDEAMEGESLPDTFGRQFSPRKPVHDVATGRFTQHVVYHGPMSQNFSDWVTENQFGLIKWKDAERTVESETLIFSAIQVATQFDMIPADVSVDVEQVLQPWTDEASSLTYDDTAPWGDENATGQTDTRYVDALDLESGPHRFSIDITAPAKEWFEGMTVNNGLLFRTTTGTNLEYPQFPTNKHPFSVIGIYHDQTMPTALPVITETTNDDFTLTWTVDVVDPTVVYEVYLDDKLWETTVIRQTCLRGQLRDFGEKSKRRARPVSGLHE